MSSQTGRGGRTANLFDARAVGTAKGRERGGKQNLSGYAPCWRWAAARTAEREGAAKESVRRLKVT